MEKQIANRFDEVTVTKIIKGAGISATGTFAVIVLEAIGKLQINDPILAAIVVFAVPFLVNVIKEYQAGIKI